MEEEWAGAVSLSPESSYHYEAKRFLVVRADHTSEYAFWIGKTVSLTKDSQKYGYLDKGAEEWGWLDWGLF